MSDANEVGLMDLIILRRGERDNKSGPSTHRISSTIPLMRSLRASSVAPGLRKKKAASVMLRLLGMVPELFAMVSC